MELIERLKKSNYISSLYNCIGVKSPLNNDLKQILICEYIYQYSHDILLYHKMYGSNLDRIQKKNLELYLVMKAYVKDKIKHTCKDFPGDFCAAKNEYYLKARKIYGISPDELLPKFEDIKYIFSRKYDIDPLLSREKLHTSSIVKIGLCFFNSIDISTSNHTKKLLQIVSGLDSLYVGDHGLFGRLEWMKHRLLYWHRFSQITQRYFLAYNSERNPLPPEKEAAIDLFNS